MMTDNRSFAARAQAVLTPNYRPPPLVLERGEGVYAFDIEGRRYLDMTAGIAVSALGHAHPRLIEALRAQLDRLLHTSNLYLNRPSIELAERLVAASCADRVYFCNSGTEANEAALKLARRYAHDRGHAERYRIVSFSDSFHGRTFGALSATAQPKYHEGFGPMPEGFDYLPLGDLGALASAVDHRTAGVIVEPIQGEGGVNLPPAGFLRACRDACDAAGAVLIFDEVQAGVGRTGRVFAHEHEGVVPDVMTLAKGLGGGMPLGALVARDEVGRSFGLGTHGSTYGGNPMACTAGTVMMDTVAQPAFLAHVTEVGARLRQGLEAIGSKTGLFQTVRGRGLMLGVQLAEGVPFDAPAVVEAARAEGLLVHVAGPRVLRLLPPLILQASHADEALDGLDRVLQRLAA